MMAKESIRIERYEVAPAMLELAMRRVRFVTTHCIHLPFNHMLATAYMQGMSDAIDVLQARTR